MNISFFCVLLAYICSSHAFVSWMSALLRQSNKNLKLRMSLAPVTYKPVSINLPNSKRSTLLVKNGDPKVLQEISSWKKMKKFDSKKLDEWKNEGLAFWFDPDNTKSLLEAETSSKLSRTTNPVKFTEDIFLNIAPKGSAEVQLISASRLSAVKDINDGVIDFSHLEREGNAFTNLTMLFRDRQVINRADDIAVRLASDFSIQSPQWRTWINKTASYNQTPLGQALAHYYQHHSVGDVGGKNVKYIPKRGYPGTLAPGEMFKDTNPVETLPNRILHPWPIMQEIQFHVRQPPSHPMIPPPVLWFALNDMFVPNFTQVQLNVSMSDKETFGGMAMEARDAIKIAKFAHFGKCYDPKIQLKHGGSIFDSGCYMPNYNPDHGPTVPMEEVIPPIPEELLPLTERWLDPSFGLEIKVSAPAPASAEATIEEELLEESLRREAMERELQKIGLEAADLDDVTEPESVVLQKSLEQSIAGRARPQKAIIKYTIATISKLKEDVILLERDVSSKRKSGRKKRRQELDLDAPLPFDTSPNFFESDSRSSSSSSDSDSDF